MKKRFLVLFAIVALVLPSLLLTPRPALAAGWAEVDSPTGDTLFSLDTYSDTFIAVGTDGTVVYSDDGGDSWYDGDSNTNYDLYGVALMNADKAVAVGQYAKIIRTTNGGDDWSSTSISIPTSHVNDEFRAVYMVSTSVGWAVGADGMIVKTTDGGQSWGTVNSPTDESLNHVDAVSTSVVWVVGESGVIYKSTNGGTSWSRQISGTSENLTGIDMYSATVGYACGDNETLLKTTDGGSDWDTLSASELSSGETVADLSFRTDEDGIATGASGTMLKTTDGGDNWSQVDANLSEAVLEVVAVSASEWWGVGDNGMIARYDSSSPDAPANFDVAGTNSNVTDPTPTFSWSDSDDSETDIDYYEFKMDSNSYKNVGNVTSKTYSTDLDDGSHTAYVRAVDDSGNTSSASSVTFIVDTDTTSSGSGSVDIERITPTSAIKNTTVVFNAMMDDDDGSIDSCRLYIDGVNEKSMTVKADVAYTTWMFTATGSYTMYAKCTDEDGDTSSGSSVTVKVINTSSYADAGDIIKIGCSGNVYVNDPCTAVYYYGEDGRRHAFPNESVFKSWFDDFDDLVTVTSSAMSDITLGENVTYKPGEQLVQFSDATVYAVSYAGILRPIANSTIAKALFGSSWTNEIKGVNDVFYGNYRIGSTIESSADYSESAVKSASGTIDTTF